MSIQEVDWVLFDNFCRDIVYFGEINSGKIHYFKEEIGEMKEILSLKRMLDAKNGEEAWQYNEV